MKKIAIVDYIGNCDQNGEITGHVEKTLTEAATMLKEKVDVYMIVTQTHAKYYSDFDVKYTLKHDSSPLTQSNLWKRILLRFKKIKAIKKVLLTEKTIWFANTDFFLFVALLFYKKKPAQRIYVTNYIDYYNKSGLKKRITSAVYKKAMRCIDGVFCTNRNVNLPKHIYVPDYWFKKENYKKYNHDNKINAVYMCGGINHGKDVEGSVDAFNKNQQPFVIKGKFSSIELYEKVKKEAENNIEISNERLSYDEYYSNLAKYKYVLLPYNFENYNHRSSGVILEAIFLKCIVIGPRFLLEQLGITGLQYSSIQELEEFKLDSISEEETELFIRLNNSIISMYDYKNVKKTYFDTFGLS